jgi:hypothetical protein
VREAEAETVKQRLIAELRERLLEVTYAINRMGPFELTRVSRRKLAEEANRGQGHGEDKRQEVS